MHRTAALIAIFVIVSMILLYMHSIEPFDQKRHMYAERLSSMAKGLNGKDPSFNQAKKAYPDLDVAEYYSVRETMKSCRDGCADTIYTQID